ncbi:MAG: LptF/LptG family permease [Phycisphaeraceae bacterium]|nr:LptF/LptG family permease [Phycisphaeraceae bacterium]
MTILDRYIARQYIINTAVLLFVLFAFVVTIDVAFNIERFIAAAEALDPNNKTSGVRLSVVTVFLIADLWWPRLLQLFNFLIGLVLTASMGFTLTQLVRHRELVAVLASGVSLYRVARPITIVTVAVLLVQVINQEAVIPRLAENGLLTRDYRDAGPKGFALFEVPMVADGQGNIFYAVKFDKNTDSMQTVHVWQRGPEGQAVRRLSAPLAVWRPAEPGPGGAWELRGVSVVPLRPSSPGSPASPAATPPSPATPGAEPAPGSVALVQTDLDPTRLLLHRYSGFSQSLSWGQISQMLASKFIDEPTRNRLERVRWGRLALLVSNVLAILINLPFFLTREPKNMVIQSLKCAPVGLVTMMGGVLLTSWSLPGLPPQFGVFLPVLILAPVAILRITSMET